MSNYRDGHWRTLVEHASLSDVGMRRTNNQDSHALMLAGSEQDWLRRGHVFMVADGMGAHAAGELASKIATDTVPLNYFKRPEDSPAEAIARSIQDANARIHDRGRDNPDFRGMGTTSSVLILLPQGAVVAHVGDSRVYRLRGNRLDQLSFDHSLIWEMMAAGKLREADLPGVPKNIITRSLGPSPEVKVDLEGPFPLEAGDIFLLCSDGLSGQVNDEEIGVVLSVFPPNEAVRLLVDLANLRGGPDNITVIVAKVGDPANAPAPEPDDAPLKPTRDRAVHPLAWLFVLAVAVVAPLLFHFEQPILGIVAAACAVITAVALLVVNQRPPRARAYRFNHAPLGRGPHRTWTCEPNAAVAERLGKIVDQLAEAARDGEWAIDPGPFEAQVRRAAEAREQQDFRTAIEAQGRAVMQMMQQLRALRGSGDPTLGFDTGDF